MKPLYCVKLLCVESTFDTYMKYAVFDRLEAEMITFRGEMTDIRGLATFFDTQREAEIAAMDASFPNTNKTNANFFMFALTPTKMYRMIVPKVVAA